MQVIILLSHHTTHSTVGLPSGLPSDGLATIDNSPLFRDANSSIKVTDGRGSGHALEETLDNVINPRHLKVFIGMSAPADKRKGL